MPTDSVGFLMNEGITFTWNEEDNKLELRNRRNVILSTIDANLFISKVAKGLFIVGNNIVLTDASGNTLSSSPITIESVQDLPQALDSKVDKSSVSAVNTNPRLYKIAEINRLVINETVTELVSPFLDGNDLVLKFVNESGVQQSVSIDLGSIKTTDINVENASYNASTNIISIVETDG